MAVLNIRNLPDEVHAKLRVRAAEAGRSMEAEARAILTAVILKNQTPTSPSDLQEWVSQLYGVYKPTNAVETLLAERREDAASE
jgi:Antitoxin FitA-like, ribbon-helix-helix